VEKERVRLEWISAAEGEKFASVLTQMTEEIRRLGPLKWKGNGDSIPQGSGGE